MTAEERRSHAKEFFETHSFDEPSEDFMKRTRPFFTPADETDDPDATNDGDSDDKAAPVSGSLAAVRRLAVERGA